MLLPYSQLWGNNHSRKVENIESRITKEAEKQKKK